MKFTFLNGIGGEQSSKRLFTFILIILWVIYFFSNLFFKYELKQSFEDNLFYMVLVMYLGVLAEKALPWLMKRKDTNLPNPPTP